MLTRPFSQTSLSLHTWVNHELRTNLPGGMVGETNWVNRQWSCAAVELRSWCHRFFCGPLLALADWESYSCLQGPEGSLRMGTVRHWWCWLILTRFVNMFGHMQAIFLCIYQWLLVNEFFLAGWVIHGGYSRSSQKYVDTWTKYVVIWSMW